MADIEFTADSGSLVKKLSATALAATESELVEEFGRFVLGDGNIYCWNDTVGVMAKFESDQLDGTIAQKPILPLLRTLEGEIKFKVSDSTVTLAKGESHWALPLEDKVGVVDVQSLFDVAEGECYINVNEDFRGKVSRIFPLLDRARTRGELDGIIVDPSNNRIIGGTGMTLLAVPLDLKHIADTPGFIIPSPLCRIITEIPGDGKIWKSDDSEKPYWAGNIGEYRVVSRNNESEIAGIIEVVTSWINAAGEGIPIVADLQKAAKRAAATGMDSFKSLSCTSEGKKFLIRQKFGEKYLGEDVVNLGHEIISFEINSPERLVWAFEGMERFGVMVPGENQPFIHSQAKDGSWKFTSAAAQEE